MKRGRKVLRAALVACAAAVATAAMAASASAAPGVNLRVLIISAGGEATAGAWQSTLQQENVPFDTWTPSQITAAALRDGTRGRFQAVILTNPNALTATQAEALRAYEVAFGVREIDPYVWPSATYGLNTPSVLDPGAAGLQTGVVGSLTTAGRTVFPYLVGPIPYDGYAWGYRATPAPLVNFTPLVTGPNGSALLGVFKTTDGRERLVSTIDANAHMLHHQLLAHGALVWATKGTYLGYARNYLGLHIDDVFLANERWDTVQNTIHEGTEDPARVIWMTPANVTRAVNWQTANGLRMDMVFNGDGADGEDGGTRPNEKLPTSPSPTGSGNMDRGDAETMPNPYAIQLSAALMKVKDKFTWINHTWDHTELDDAPSDFITNEIYDDQWFAMTHNLRHNGWELVTGAHSGLANPALPEALANTGITWIAADASRMPEQVAIGQALTIPRWPTNVYYNTATKAEQLDEYNYLYYENCTFTSCLTSKTNWDQYVQREVETMFRHVVANDVRPHFFHQSNLAEDGLFYLVVDALLKRYRSYFSVPLVNPTFDGASTILERQGKWKAAVTAKSVSGYVQDGKIYLTSTGPTTAPLTGSAIGDVYGGVRSGWATLRPGTTTVINVNR